MGLQVDSTISVGNLLSLAVIVAAIAKASSDIRSKLTALETMVTPMWNHFCTARQKQEDRENNAQTQTTRPTHRHRR